MSHIVILYIYDYRIIHISGLTYNFLFLKNKRVEFLMKNYWNAESLTLRCYDLRWIEQSFACFPLKWNKIWYFFLQLFFLRIINYFKSIILVCENSARFYVSYPMRNNKKKKHFCVYCDTLANVKFFRYFSHYALNINRKFLIYYNFLCFIYLLIHSTFTCTPISFIRMAKLCTWQIICKPH